MITRISARLSSTNNLYSSIGLFLLFSVGATCLIILPFTVSGDGYVRFQFMDALVHRLQITPMRYSMVGPLVSLPLWVVTFFVKDPIQIVSRYNFLLYVCFLVALYQMLKVHFDQKFLVTFVFILSFGTMFPGYLTDYYGDVFSAGFLALGTVALTLDRRWLGWSCMLLAAINTPALLVPFALVAMYTSWRSRQLRYLLLAPLCAMLIVLESRVRMGGFLSVFQTYLGQAHGFKTVLPFSGKIGYSYPFLLGILSILFSFGKGLVFYLPGLALIGWAWKSADDAIERMLLILWLLITAGLVIAYSSWWAWYGGWSWGPRFFLFASFPAAWILARLLHSEHRSFLRTLILVACVVLSLWVGVNGIVFRQKTLDVCTQHNYALESLCWYVPEFSPLIRPFIAQAALGTSDKLLLVIYVGLCLYAVAPLALPLVAQARALLKAGLSSLRISAWRV